MMKPSDLDKRAAVGFQELAKQADYFPVTCRFRKPKRTLVTTADEDPWERVDHVFWPEGAEEFTKHFGHGASYFAGALEYVRLATGWGNPYRSLDVTVLKSRRKISNGFFFKYGFHGKGPEVRIIWANGEFTLTVLHELVHVFKGAGNEQWVEEQALKLTMGV